MIYLNITTEPQNEKELFDALNSVISLEGLRTDLRTITSGFLTSHIYEELDKIDKASIIFNGLPFRRFFFLLRKLTKPEKIDHESKH